MLSKCKVCGAVIDVEKDKDFLCSQACRENVQQGKSEDKAEPEFCAICGKPATFTRTPAKIRIPTCQDPGCKKTTEKEYYKIIMRNVRNKCGQRVCEVPGCGFAYGVKSFKGLRGSKEDLLCPNHLLLVGCGQVDLRSYNIPKKP